MNQLCREAGNGHPVARLFSVASWNRLGVMPEGHVIHKLARELTDKFGGKQVRVSSPQGRFADATAILDGTVLEDADAVGKHLFINFEARQCVWIHLGLIGKFRFKPLSQIENYDTLRLLIADSKIGAELRGPQWCRLITPEEKLAVIAKSGPDPLRDDADPERAWKKVHNAKRTIAQLLMDQGVFAGVGNIYRAEVLFRHGVDPKLPANKLSREVFDSIWADLAALMRADVLTGQIDTVDPEHSPEKQQRDPRVDEHGGEVYVYRRAGQECLVCGEPIQLELYAGRNLYWCPKCQPQASGGEPRAKHGGAWHNCAPNA